VGGLEKRKTQNKKNKKKKENIFFRQEKTGKKI
jgi:hypothetical protein